MGAATEFLGFAHGHDPNRVAVLLAEKRDGSALLGLGDGQHVSRDGKVAQHAEVGQVLDFLLLLGRKRREVRKIETQAIGRHQRTLLGHVFAQHRTQGPVQEMGGRVVAPDGVAAFDIHGQFHGVTHLDAAAIDLA